MSILVKIRYSAVNVGGVMNKLYEWLFSEEERAPIGYIPLFAMIVVISSVVCLFILSVSRAIMWI